MRPLGFLTPSAFGPLADACRSHLRLAAGLSALVNILYLAPTLYMMQVYDRVVPTGGVTTLLWLTGVVVLALSAMAMLDWVRARVLIRAGLKLENRFAALLLDRSFDRGGRARQPMRDFDDVRQALSGPPVIAVFDVMWTPIYLLVALLVHPALAGAVLVAALILLAITAANERASRRATSGASRQLAGVHAAQERTAQQHELVRALGLRSAMAARLLAERRRALTAMAGGQFEGARFTAMAKFVRLAAQSLALGLGGLLAVQQQISIGGIIAASVLMSRALQPIEQLVASWASLVQARAGAEALAPLLAGEDTTDRFELPRPRGRVSAENVAIASPDPQARPLLSGISFDVDPGEFIGIIGPSGAGKSTLARLLAGAIAPTTGTVRIDGSNLQAWPEERLAAHIGYLPQDAALLPGTIAENISRFALARGEDAAEISARVVQAARKAGAFDLIARLPGGFDRLVGWNGEGVSAGQRQRIALARALYGNPAILVLDEPNSALDAEGERALVRAIDAARAGGATVFVAAHRAALLADASRLLLLLDGELKMFGPRPQVMARLRETPVAPALVDAGAD